jgi:bifunctional DNA-binding transcriptional regulator/antitoxin component of YhaV-PrlF toxin-antitoxin module
MAKKRIKGPSLGEAAVAYNAEPPLRMVYPVLGTTRLSTKNQITLPVAYVRDLGLKPGDEVNVWLEKSHIVVERKLHGKELLDSLQGALKYEEWSTKEKVDEWLRAEREGWDREWDTASS